MSDLPTCRRSRMPLIGAICLGAVVANGPVQAAREVTTGTDFVTGHGYLLRASVDIGGEDLLTITGTDGERTGLSAGRGMTLEAGVRLDLRPFERPAWESELTIGLKHAETGVGSGSVSFSRTLLAVSQFYRFRGGLRAGVGAGLHVGASLDVDVPGFEGASSSFDGALEYRAMLEYGLRSRYAIGARLSRVSYESNGIGVDGSSVGAYVSVRTR